jgi:hypothetical protein
VSSHFSETLSELFRESFETLSHSALYASVIRAIMRSRTSGLSDVDGGIPSRCTSRQAASRNTRDEQVPIFFSADTYRFGELNVSSAMNLHSQARSASESITAQRLVDQFSGGFFQLVVTYPRYFR